MLFKKIIAVNSENFTKPCIHPLGKHSASLIIKAGGLYRLVTTGV
jgi:hypothetical protein